jgi:hypothetical protein
MLLRIPVVNSIIRKTTTEIRVERQNILSQEHLIASLVNWFETIGITVLEGYGMSEDTIISF